jgi:pyrroloquinoline quinone (PQQ) biosynthesis protein C
MEPGKSKFLLQHKEAWDRLNIEVANLRIHEAEAHRHADDAKRMALEQLERSRKDDEVAAVIQKERDKLLQRDAAACQ